MHGEEINVEKAIRITHPKVRIVTWLITSKWHHRGFTTWTKPFCIDLALFSCFHPAFQCCSDGQCKRQKAGRGLVASFPGSAQLSVWVRGEPGNEARTLEHYGYFAFIFQLFHFIYFPLKFDPFCRHQSWYRSLMSIRWQRHTSLVSSTKSLVRYVYIVASFGIRCEQYHGHCSSLLFSPLLSSPLLSSPLLSYPPCLSDIRGGDIW